MALAMKARASLPKSSLITTSPFEKSSDVPRPWGLGRQGNVSSNGQLPDVPSEVTFSFF